MAIKRQAVIGCVVAAALSVGCGGSKARLDCAWLASNNCWKSTIAASASCLPASGDIGTLSADGRTCTYPNGIVVTFDNPLTLSVPDGTLWKFTVANGGQQCFRYEATTLTSAKVTTPAGTVSQSTSGFSLDFTCPNGVTYESANALDLLSCSSGALTLFPGTTWSSSTNFVSFGVLGASSGSMPIFNCQRN